jgi:hypothetical protein
MRALAAMLASSALILCACGGGGGGGDSSSGASSPPAPTEPSPSQPPPSQQPPSQQPPSQPSPSGPVTLSGVVAAESAFAGYGIEVLAGPAAPGSVKHVPSIEADGRYTVALESDVQPPFLLHVIRPDFPRFPQYPRLYSITKHGGTANVTPLTDLLVARLLNRVPADSTDLRAVTELQNRSDVEIAAAQRQVVAYLLNRPSRDNGNVVSPVDVSAVTDFVSMPLVAAPGDPHFEALRRLHASLMDTESIVGVEQHMLFGNDPPADLRSIFALDFLADCVGSRPEGRLRIIVDRRGTKFGDSNVSHGQSLSILVDPSAGILTWVVQRGSNQVQVSTAEGRVSSIVFFDEETREDLIRCVPVGEVSVAGKYPSPMALIRLLAQSIRNPVIQCAAPITVPGFVVGANTVAIEQNGALRINGPGGPAFHLPSFSFRIGAGLSMAADGVAPTSMGYNFGEAQVAVSDDGRITALLLHSMECRVPLSSGQ